MSSKSKASKAKKTDKTFTREELLKKIKMDRD